MRNEKGMSLIEVLLVLVAASLLITAVASFSLPWMARESTKGAIYTVQTYLQLARIEAVTRNRDCYFEIETNLRRLQVIDTSGSVVLYETTMPDNISFAHPTGGSPVSLAAVGGALYRCTFSSDGTVGGGQGAVILFGGEIYERASVYLAGGIEVENWNGSGWEPGS